MKKIIIDKVRPGMITARDIYSLDKSRILMAKGLTLSELHLERLKELGIKYLYVIEEGKEPSGLLAGVPKFVH